MTIKDILAKLLKGETLTDEEKQFAEKFDIDKAMNDAAAAARRKAEEAKTSAERERDTLKTQLEDLHRKIDAAGKSGQTDLEKASGQIKALSDQVAALSTRLEKADKDKAAMARTQKLDALRQAAGIAFVTGVDDGAMSGLFRGEFDGIADAQLADETVVKGVIDKFRGRFAGVIRDDSGHGAGGHPHVGGGGGGAPAKNPWKKETFNLTEQAKVMKENPAAAKRYAAEAGVTLPEA